MNKQKTGIVHSEFHNDHLIEIRDTAIQRSLFFDKQHLQSAMSFLDPQELILSYTRYMLLGLLINDQPQDILIIGLGSGSFVRFFNHYYPHCHIDGVDYSQHIIDLAKGYFRLPETKNITISCADGAHFVRHQASRKYDLILVDAFDAIGMAPTIYNVSFFERVQTMLKDDGSISFNLWSSDKTIFSNIKKSLVNTFTSCLFLPVPDRGNVIAVTMNQKTPWEKIDPPQTDIQAISTRLGLNFSQLIRVAKQNNGHLKTLLKSLFRGRR
ncbi:spermine/spermidine synthase domain-containing protein [Desulforhopalus sp. 52FAK]